MLAGLVLGLTAIGVLAAPPAAAIDDPAVPDARVTGAPSCRPGGLVVEVVGGTAPYAVRLATTRAPAGEDEGVVQPGETVVLRTGDVAPGETIDGRLEYTAQDGSGPDVVDELAGATFTRPTAEACEQATESPDPEPGDEPPTPAEPTTPAEPAPAPPTTTGPRPPPSSSPEPTPSPSAPSSSAPAPSAPSTPAPTTAPRPPAPPAEAREGAAPVERGSTLRVRVDGYQPGELVTFTLHGSDEVLGSATADDDGAVVTQVLIPAWTAAGPVSLDAVGTTSSAVAGVPLDVTATAVTEPAEAGPPLVPLLAAAAALAVAGGALVSMTKPRPGRG
ncbi:hypothetical protein JKP75_01020 [Blastococcus sp. TML/M2B]|uniref:hypothetical protein n=1 Tax=unclassified Blastococcus TaxID=2619396 RepID=UPI00190E4EC5|nr:MULTISPECIES: hypothetical protein [unclassified Blastococcus]MBN1091302.1 hypothetical protein [Blastococcus sp. TML/M2B]MBN1095141.1 hypothetical protein [Blastococcus sp. TML/C7B]